MDYALSQNKISGVMLVCFENDRPLQGSLAALDWRFNGHFTQLQKKQILTGSEGEVLFAPLRWNQQVFQFLILGGGFLNSEIERPLRSRNLFELGLQKLDELKLTRMGASRRDWNISEDHSGAVERGLWIVN
ncbi:MAG: hypothetical protein KGP28_06050 [Bdellovibrionales bacterium]|nr:hypothetical protein [Bdellovibrionales bacterium]